MIHFFQKMDKAGLVAFVALTVFAGVALAGSLTPPGSPASTMNTLEEVFDSIAGAFDSSAIVADQNGSLIEHLKYIEANMGSGGVGSDSLDFDEFVDNMTLDATTTVNHNGFFYTFRNDYSDPGFVGEANGLNIDVLNSGSGSIFTSKGLGITLDNTGSGFIIDAYGIQVIGPNTNPVANYYGLYLQDNSAFVTGSGYGVYQSGDLPNFFGGNVGIGTSNPAAQLHVQASPGGSRTAYFGPASTSFDSIAQFYISRGDSVIASLNPTRAYGLSVVNQSDTGNDVFGMNGLAEDFHGSGTVTNVVGVEGDAYVEGAGDVTRLIGTAGFAEYDGSGTVANAASLYGYANALGAGVQNNYGLYLEDQSFSAAANNFQLYSAGTALSYFAGNVSVSSDFEVNGHTAMGNVGGVDNSLLTIGIFGTNRSVLALNERITALEADNNHGISNDLEIELAADSAASFTGQGNYVTVTGANTGDIFQLIGAYNTLTNLGTGDIVAMQGAVNSGAQWGPGTVGQVYGTYNNACNCPGGGNITEAFGTYTDAQSSSTGTIATAYDLYAGPQFGGGTITNNYGVYIAAQNGLGVVNGYNFYSAGAGTRNIFEGHASVGGNFELTGTVSSNLTPTVTDTFDLGTSALRWRDLYLASGSLHIGTSGDEAVIDYNVNDDYLSFKPDGTTTTLRIFDNGNASISGNFEVGNNFITPNVVSGNASISNRLEVGQGASISGQFFVTSAGNVGIGTDNPNGKVEIKNTAVGGETTSGIRFTGPDGTNMNLFSGDLNNFAGYLTFGGVGSGWSFHIADADDGGATKFVTFTDAGNVGIGTTNPLTMLQLSRSLTQTTYGAADTGNQGIAIIDSSNVGGHPVGVQFGGYLNYTFGGVYGVMTSAGNNTTGDITFALRAVGNNTLFSERMRITSGGSIGIGTTTPAALLDVAASSSFTTSDLFKVASTSPANTLFIIKKSGNVGIGTATPSARLDVAAASGSANLVVYTGPASTSFHATAQGYIDYGSNVFTNLNTGSTGRGAALVGISEDNSATDVVANYGLGLSRNAAGTRDLIGGIEGDAIHIGAGAVNRVNGVLGFARNGGAATVQQLAAFYAYPNTNDGGGTVVNNYGLRIEDQSGVGTNNYAIYTAGNTPSVFDGRVGIGTATPSVMLHVASTAFDGDIFRLQDSDGDCTVNPEAVTTFSCSSDRRLKDNIEDTQPILARIMNFRVRDFTMRSSGDHQTGVIAQEVQETWPNMVSMGASGYLKVEQPNPWLVIKAIQELNGKIEDLAEQGPMQFDEQGLFDRFVAYLKDVVLKVQTLIAGEVRTDKICVGDTCVTEEQFQAVFGASAPEPSKTPAPEPTPTEEPTPTLEVTPTNTPEPTPETTPESTSEPEEQQPSETPEIQAE